MASAGAAGVIRFGAFEFDLSSRDLRKGRTRIRVPDQSAAILAMLLERPGELVSREEIQARLWPNGTVVEFEHSVNSAVKRLREALSDTAATPRFVETLPRRGYRFVGTLEPVDAGPIELAPGTIISHYRILSEAGRGAMGVVYKAEDTRLGRLVALKFLPEELATHPPALERLRREARMIGALNHPGICTVYDLEEASGRVFLVMEFMEGETLRERMARGPLGQEELFEIAVQAAKALEAAHGQGMVHRDIKPDNLFLTRQSVVKLMDFGLAKPVGEQSGAAQQSSVTGTSGYMSPEQMRGEPLDARTDIYSFGRVLAELAGEPVNSKLAPILKKALAADPAERWQSAGELLAALERVRRKRWPRTALLMGLAGAGLIALALGLFVNLRSRMPAEKHLLVLPFVNLGGGVPGQAFCDGVAETLSSSLTRLEQFQGSLRVVPASEVRQQKLASARDARRAFGVNLVVSGSVQRQQDRVLVTVNLIDPQSLRQLGAETGRFDSSDLPELQDWAIARVAHMLEVTVRPATMSALAATRPRSAEAYQFYLQGRGHLARYYAPEDLAQAEAAFRQAVQADANYAPGYAGLAEVLWRVSRDSNDPERLDQAEQNCRRALDLDGKLVQARIMLGRIQNSKGSYDAAVRTLKSVLEQEPSNAEATSVLARAYEDSKRPEEAEKAWRKAADLRPGSWSGYNNLAGFYFGRRRFAEAEPLYRRVIQLTPEYPLGYLNLGSLYVLMGRYDEAVAQLERSLAIKPTAVGYTNLGSAYFYQGRYADAVAMAAKAVSQQPGGYLLWGNLGDFCLRVPGQEERARSAWRRAGELAGTSLSINAGEPLALSSLALYTARLGNPSAALMRIAQATKADPQNRDVLFNSVLVYEITGRRREALTALRAVLELGESMERIRRQPEFAELRRDVRCSEFIPKEVCNGR
jgi:tetratricopeptide (TPR) repeat protein/DNA-binding winged helix-turn-helix (wHTH) protein/TolB-like protein